MKYIRLIAPAALLIGATPAYAVDWIYVTTSNSGSVWYYDANTIRRSGDLVTVWERWDHSRDETVKQRERRIRSRLDCGQRTVTTLNSTSYYPDGKLETFTWEAHEQEERPITPGTNAETMLDAVCAATAR